MDVKTIKKIKLCFMLFLLLIVFFLAVSAVIDLKDSSRARIEIPLMMEKDLEVAKVKILTDEGDFGNVELAMDIYFKDNGILSVSKVDGGGRGPIRIYRIGDYKIDVMDNYGTRKTLTIDLLEYIIGLRLETVFDLTKNYNLIHRCIERLPNISEYKKTTYESINTVIDRMLAEYRDDCKIISFKDKKYFLAKYNYNDFEPCTGNEKF
jgi:hypothetical protein